MKAIKIDFCTLSVISMYIRPLWKGCKLFIYVSGCIYVSGGGEDLSVLSLPNPVALYYGSVLS